MIRRRKGLESRQNPQRRVHALLGNLPADQNLCPKRQHRKLDRILPATWILTKTQNHSQPKHLLEKNGQYHHRLCQSKNLAEKMDYLVVMISLFAPAKTPAEKMKK
jgi:hypothetical protein